MRISDWSSDVCSSDLQQQQGHAAQPQVAGGEIVKPLLKRLADLEVTPENHDAEEQQQNVEGPSDAAGQREGQQAKRHGDTQCADTRDRLVKNADAGTVEGGEADDEAEQDRKSTRLNSSH